MSLIKENRMDELNKEVKEPEKGGEPSTPQEPVSSPEVKKEVELEVKPVEVVPDKDKEQISNLNIALKQEREFRKKSDEKISQLESQLKESSETFNRFKQVFNPVEPEPKAPSYMTKEEAEIFWQEKSQELERKQVESKQIEKIKSEISTLEKEFNGKSGKPKYVDQDVLQWQKDNNKEYLTPREAFFEMKHDDIVDWKVKERLSNKKDVFNVEKPSGGGGIHQPQGTTPKTDQEIRQAILEAMDSVDKVL